AAVVFGVEGDKGANVLREGEGDARGGHVGSAEGLGEEVGVKRFSAKTGHESGEGHAHLDWVLNGLEDLVFEGGGAFVPEEMAAGVVAGVSQSHGVAGADASVKADAETARISEAEFGLMAGGAGDSLVGGEALVVE